MIDFTVRQMTQRDRSEVADLIYISINHWYVTHGRPPIFVGGPDVTDVFFDVYERLDPGCGLVAENSRTGRLMGSCFYHPRPHHMSLGIMNCHPVYFGRGVGRSLLRAILDIAHEDRKPVRLTQSAINLESFSLYNKAGFVPRKAFQDMFVRVPESGMNRTVSRTERIRPAKMKDVPAMASLEMAVSGITREQDYKFCIENADGNWRVVVIEGDNGIDGFAVSCGHPAMNMIGPLVCRTQEQAAAVILHELDQYRGRTPVFLVPVDCDRLVRQVYEWGGQNCELHFCQVLGDFPGFNGVSMPSFLPETA